ncbi:MAG TPA: hypothetical protein VG269_00485 [Tepidisphaeraceae bacterium]|nr:hypothetical protein [Tepidisphaeraceae bacterium]
MHFTKFVAWAGIQSRAWIAQPGKSAFATAILGVAIGSAWRVVILRYAGPSSANAAPALYSPSNANGQTHGTDNARESRPAPATQPAAASRLLEMSDDRD